jgi:malate dehydrogenase (oxaloacetate-decarboxylating)
MAVNPSASYSLTIRILIPQRPGAFAEVAKAIGDEGGILGAIDLVRSEQRVVTRDVTVSCSDVDHGDRIVAVLRKVQGIEVRSVSDRTFLLHRGGKIEVTPKISIKSRDDLSMAYTPGVGRICQAIADDPLNAWTLTIKKNTVAVVTDGTAILGLGDLGPAAAMPVMEGKALLFKEFAGVDAFPICLDTKDPDEIVRIVKAISPGFGGINLEDISAPRCFEIETRLRNELDIPVFHDDQHGTAIVVLSALINALNVVHKRVEDIRVVVVGVGAAGTACTNIMLAHGVRRLVGVDEFGIVYDGRENLDSARADYAQRTNSEGLRGDIRVALHNADVVIGLSRPGAIPADAIATMAKDPIVFALANPQPEVQPEDIQGLVAVMATGRSDYPNQINNVLAFPGVFRGALDVRASTINEEMKLAAALAIAETITDDELNAEYIMPSVFNRSVSAAVAKAVAKAAIATGVARRTSITDEFLNQ